MKLPTFGPLSTAAGVTRRTALTAVCITATLFACQSNTPSPAVDSTSSAPATDAPQPGGPAPGLPAEPSSATVVDAPTEGAETADDTKPSATPTGAKTPRPKSENGKDAVEPKPTPSTATVAQAPKETPEGQTGAIDKPCLAKTFEFAAVKSACEKGGVPQAKALMKSWTKKAKEKGEEYKCTSCHDNQRTYSNKPGADADLRTLLNIIK